MISPKFTRVPLLAIACAGILTFSACGGDNNSTSQNIPAPSTSSVATATATPTQTGKPTPEPSKTSSAPKPAVTDNAEPSPGTVTTVEPSTAPPENTEPTGTNSSDNAPSNNTAICDYGQIHISAEVAPGGGAAGSRYMNITFTNSGSSPCSLSGYPSVNYVDSNGNQIGASAQQAAEWTSSGSVLGSGESAVAPLRETRAGLYDQNSCQPTQAAGYRIGIPGTSSSLVMNFPAEACSGTSQAQLSVGQIGAGLN